ncbi:hypothetical protein JXA63_03725 [Candidatus Woesebacteria bacterium]|nr:hypothetical protein [Candidatus Woesebacteria bacterium]
MALLQLYPMNYRKEFSEQMFLDFCDMYKESKQSDGGNGLFKLWAKIFPDFILSLIREYMYEKKGGEYILKKEFDTLGLIFWVLIGMAVFPVTFIISMYLDSLFGGNIETQIAWIVFIPLLLISFIGSQWLILRKYTKRAKDWIINTFSAWIVMFLATFVFFVVSQKILSLDLSTDNQSQIIVIQLIQSIIYGSILGIFQKRALEGYSNTWLFVPANIISLGMIFVSIQESISNSVDMMLIGTYPALFTGLALLFVLRNRTKSKNSKVSGMLA